MTRAVFQELYERLGPTVWAVAYARHLDSAAALDVMQECFLRLWRESRRGTRIEQPKAWLLQVARNLAEDVRKSAFSRNGTRGPVAMAVVQDRAVSPLAHLVSAEERARVRQLLKELPEADREVLTLRYALEWTTEAIAEELGINAAAVLMRLSRARARLAELLEEKERASHE